MLVCTAALMLCFFTPVMSWSHGWIIYCTCSASVPISPSGHLWYCRQKSMHLEMNFFTLNCNTKKKLKDTSDLKDCSYLSILFLFSFYFWVVDIYSFKKWKLLKVRKSTEKTFIPNVTSQHSGKKKWKMCPQPIIGSVRQCFSICQTKNSSICQVWKSLLQISHSTFNRSPFATRALSLQAPPKCWA